MQEVFSSGEKDTAEVKLVHPLETVVSGAPVTGVTNVTLIDLITALTDHITKGHIRFTSLTLRQIL